MHRGAATDSGPPGQHIHSGPSAFRGGGGGGGGGGGLGGSCWCPPPYRSCSSRARLVIGHTGHFPGGPTDFFFFCQGPSRRDSEQPVAHWFVSCIDGVNHPITMCYRRSNEVFFSAYIKIASPHLLPLWVFPRFHSSFITNRLALR